MLDISVNTCRCVVAHLSIIARIPSDHTFWLQFGRLFPGDLLMKTGVSKLHHYTTSTPVTMGTQAHIYLIGDQTYDYDRSLRELLHSEHEAILSSFFERSYYALRAEVGKLLQSHRGQFQRFSGLADLLVLRSDCQLHPALDQALTCIYQLGTFIRQALQHTSPYFIIADVCQVDPLRLAVYIQSRLTPMSWACALVRFLRLLSPRVKRCPSFYPSQYTLWSSLSARVVVLWMLANVLRKPRDLVQLRGR